MVDGQVESSFGTIGPEALTVIQGTSFCVSSPNGDVSRTLPHGVFFEDTRFISDWILKVEGSPVEALSSSTPEPFHAVFVGRSKRNGQQSDTSLLIDRERKIVGTGLTEVVTVHNYSQRPFRCHLELLVDTDFASLFEVKEGKTVPRGHCLRRMTEDGLVLESEREHHVQRVTVAFPGARVEGEGLVLETLIAPTGSGPAQSRQRPS